MNQIGLLDESTDQLSNSGLAVVCGGALLSCREPWARQRPVQSATGDGRRLLCRLPPDDADPRRNEPLQEYNAPDNERSTQGVLVAVSRLEVSFGWR